MDWKDCITLTVDDSERYSSDKKGIDCAIPRKAIKSLSRFTEKDYSSSEIVKRTRILIDHETAEMFGFTNDKGRWHKEGVYLIVKDEYDVVLAMLKESPAAEILFRK